LAPSLRITEKAGHAVVATLHHVLSNAGEIQPWESSHDAQHPSGNCGMLSVSIVRSRRRSAEKALWPRYPTDLWRIAGTPRRGLREEDVCM